MKGHMPLLIKICARLRKEFAIEGGRWPPFMRAHAREVTRLG
jgi:hypothetical protein